MNPRQDESGPNNYNQAVPPTEPNVGEPAANNYQAENNTPQPGVTPTQGEDLGQPTSNPVSPTDPAGTSAFSNQPQPELTPKKPRKGLMVGLIAGAIGLFAVAVTAFILYMTFNVSAADYKKAHELMNNVTDAYNDTGSVYISANNTPTEIKNSVDKINKAHKKFDSSLDELGDTKAIKRDSELKELYAELESKKTKYDKAFAAADEAYVKVLPTLSGINQVSSSSGAIAEIRDIQIKLKDIDELKDANNKELVTGLASELDKLVSLAEKVQAGREDYRKYDSNAVRDFYATSSNINKIVRDWQSNLEKMADEGELKNEINALSKKIFDKALDA